MNAKPTTANHAPLNVARREREIVIFEMDSDKQYLFTNKDGDAGSEMTIKLIPHQDGNVSMAVFNGGNTDPVFTKKLWAQPLEQAKQDGIRKLADAFPSAKREAEMKEQGILRPQQRQDRNGIKKPS